MPAVALRRERGGRAVAGLDLLASPAPAPAAQTSQCIRDKAALNSEVIVEWTHEMGRFSQECADEGNCTASMSASQEAYRTAVEHACSRHHGRLCTATVSVMTSNVSEFPVCKPSSCQQARWLSNLEDSWEAVPICGGGTCDPNVDCPPQAVDGFWMGMLLAFSLLVCVCCCISSRRRRGRERMDTITRVMDADDKAKVQMADMSGAGERTP